MSTFTKNSILNLVFNYSNIGFNVVTGVFLVPFYLRQISLDVYGSYLIAVGIAGFVALLEFGLSMVMTQRLASSFAKSDWGVFRRIVYSGIMSACLLFACTCAATLALSTVITHLTKIEPSHAEDLRMAFVILGLGAGLNIFLNLFGSIFQALLKAGALGAINFISAIVGVVCAFEAFRQHPSLIAIAAGPLARAVCASLLLLMGTAHALHIKSLVPAVAPFRETFKILKSCIPIFLGGISRSVADNTQNLLLANALSPSLVAILALTQKALQVCNMILAPIGSSIYSNLTQIKEKIDPTRFSALLEIGIGSHFLFAVLLIATASSFNELFVSLWVGADKFGGLALSLMIGFSTLLLARFYFLGFLIYATGQFKKPLMLETSYAAAKIGILYLIVGHIGLFAVPLAEIISGLIFFFYLGNRMMAPHLRLASSLSGIYFRGWLDFIIIISMGCALVRWLQPITKWTDFASAIILFMAVMMVVVYILNLTFAKQIIAFRMKSRSLNA